MPGSLVLVSEDAPTEVLAHRLLLFIDPDAAFTPSLGKKGIGYIQNRLRSLNEAASGLRIVAIADRDVPSRCPIETIRGWAGGPPHRNLMVRFAEMEVEAWVMADAERLASFLDINPTRIPNFPDRVADPKRELVNLARSSRSRQIREDVCPSLGSTSQVGPAYNAVLEAFIKNRWRPAEAIRNSPSLRRATDRIRELSFRQA